MIRISLPSVLVTSALALAFALPAQAGSLTRTFVSSAGSDANPCTLAQPCATFAAAYAATAVSGIIAALDPGKYGPLTINQAITINGNGWAAVTGPAGGAAITVNAGYVTLIGLEIDGAFAAYNGIVFTASGSLTVTNCVIQSFLDFNELGGNGILITPPSGGGLSQVFVTNTVVANNGNAGLYYEPSGGNPSATFVIDHLIANNNYYYGIAIDSTNSSGQTFAEISNSIASNNTAGGIFIAKGTSLSVENTTVTGNSGYGVSITGTSGFPIVSIDNSNVSGNRGSGITATGDAQVLLGRSTITEMEVTGSAIRRRLVRLNSIPTGTTA
jgi:nitrous oxidase accessory protein NosD